MVHGGEIYDKKIEYDFSVNLNPCPCPKEITDALSNSLSEIGRYPDYHQTGFRKALAESETVAAKGQYRITEDMCIGGNGASELLSALMRMIGPKKVLLPVPSFYGYIHALKMLDGCDVEEYFLDPQEDFALGKEFAKAIKSETDLVILANPNNPNGRLIDPDVLDETVSRCGETGTALIVDECFLRLTGGGVSARKYVKARPYVFVVDAYTKLFSIPGVRVGFIISSAENIHGIKRFLPEWNMSVFAQNAGIACARALSSGFADISAELIKTEREFLSEKLLQKGYNVYGSDSNYMLIYSDENIYERLLNEKILIRDCANYSGLGKGYYRIAVKDHVANEILIRYI